MQARTRELAKTVEDLEIASQHKSQFVANMSHELRTPLAAILGYAELMQEGFYEPLGKKSLDALTRIRSNGKHLLGLINTVLDIAKIESGQFSLNLGEYAIESVVETVRAATESLAETKKLALKTDVAKKLPVGLGDEQRLTQVLLNLVGNAIKFTDTGEVRITATAMNGHFTVAVTDTGPGIPPEELKRVFEQFHQIDNSNTKAKGGTGLGLAIAKQIVEMHGGRIWVESTLGQGATFQMELPIRAEFRKVIHDKRILVVEDQADLRGILRDLLTGSGYEMVEAADGGEGVAKAKSERPDLILMDIQLPVLDGYETTRQIKADPNLKATPIIAVSSYAMKGDEEKARASGCDALRDEALQPRPVATRHPRISRRGVTKDTAVGLAVIPTKVTAAHRAQIAGGCELAGRPSPLTRSSRVLLPVVIARHADLNTPCVICPVVASHNPRWPIEGS